MIERNKSLGGEGGGRGSLIEAGFTVGSYLSVGEYDLCYIS